VGDDGPVRGGIGVPGGLAAGCAWLPADQRAKGCAKFLASVFESGHDRAPVDTK